MRTLILQHTLYCFFKKKKVIVKDYAIFRNWIDKADSAPVERVRNEYQENWLCRAALKMQLSPSTVFFIFVPQNNTTDCRLQGFCFHKCRFIHSDLFMPPEI